MPRLPDVTDPVWQVRVKISDTNLTADNVVHSDDEIQMALSDAGGVVLLAAAMLLEQEAVDAARVSERIRIGGFGTDESAVTDKLLQMARYYRQRAPVRPVVGSSEAQFTLGNSSTGEVGTMDRW